MKHEDIKFLPYKLPYNHNYKNYVNFETVSENYWNNIFFNDILIIKYVTCI